jgi:hypothetical protein
MTSLAEPLVLVTLPFYDHAQLQGERDGARLVRRSTTSCDRRLFEPQAADLRRHGDAPRTRGVMIARVRTADCGFPLDGLAGARMPPSAEPQSGGAIRTAIDNRRQAAARTGTPLTPGTEPLVN